jgi:hypothetical protein
MSQASFAKREREKARQEKAAAKAAKRAERSQAPVDEPAPGPPVDEDALLAELAALHARFDDGDIEFEDFVVAKEAITRRLVG